MIERSKLNPFGDSSKDFAFFPSLSHRKGVLRIVTGLESNCGLILLTGEIGIGKTSLARHIQNSLSDRFVFVEIGNPYQTPLEQVFHCCEKFGLDTFGLSSVHDCVGKLEEHFRAVLREGKRPVIVFDESHLLTKRHMNLIHILSNLRADDGPLVQILLVGQLEILELLSSEGMEALNQRIGVRYELAPLVLDDAEKYINFKLQKSDRSQGVSFSSRAVRRIWKESAGLPRLINHVCAHTLDTLEFSEAKVVTPDMVDEVCQDTVYSGMFRHKSKKESGGGHRVWLTGGVAVMLFIALAAMWFHFKPEIVTMGQRLTKEDALPVSGRKLAVSPPVSPQARPEAMPVFGRKEVVPPAEPAQGSPVVVPQEAPLSNEPEVVTEVPERHDDEISPQKRRVDPIGPRTSVQGVEEGDSSPGRDADTMEGQEPEANDSPSKEVVVLIEEPYVETTEHADEADGPDVFVMPPDDQIRDSSQNPVVNSLVVGAIGWGDSPDSRVAVINSDIYHEGDTVDGVKLLIISKDSLLVEYLNAYYRIGFSR